MIVNRGADNDALGLLSKEGLEGALLHDFERGGQQNAGAPYLIPFFFLYWRQVTAILSGSLMDGAGTLCTTEL